jgi:hypothetical protein
MEIIRLLREQELQIDFSGVRHVPSSLRRYAASMFATTCIRTHNVKFPTYEWSTVDVLPEVQSQRLLLKATSVWTLERLVYL